MHSMSRRRLLRRALAAAAALGTAALARRQWSLPHSLAQSSIHRIVLPYVSRRVASSVGGRVVHAHSAAATNWNYGASYYGDYVDQSVVNEMLDRALCELTGAGTAAAAWQALMPDYRPGQGIAVKVNFNNCTSCDADNQSFNLKTDALIHPINAAIRGLSAAFAGFDPADVWIYDATVYEDTVAIRKIPHRFQDGCLYDGVRFFDGAGLCAESITFAASDPTANITWRNPAGVATPPARKVPDVLVTAAYVINMPIMKKHVSGGVTLGFKNHAGSVRRFIDFHDWIDIYSGTYSAAYNPLVDIYRNAHVGPKTVLTIGDGLYGNWESNMTVSQPWQTFGNAAANSLFVATDPVAIDCVMADFLDAESRARGYGALLPAADDYLALAAEAGLGTYERGDPWDAGYSAIDYRHIAL